jgi:hypothetical protein
MHSIAGFAIQCAEIVEKFCARHTVHKVDILLSCHNSAIDSAIDSREVDGACFRIWSIDRFPLRKNPCQWPEAADRNRPLLRLFYARSLMAWKSRSSP